MGEPSGTPDTSEYVALRSPIGRYLGAVMELPASKERRINR